MNVVFATTNATVAYGGHRVPLRVGEPWDADDPLVAAYPDFFADQVKAARSTRDPSGIVDVPVERATRAPGERRTTRRPG